MADASAEDGTITEAMNESLGSATFNETQTDTPTQDDPATSSSSRTRQPRRTALEIARAKVFELTTKTAQVRSQIDSLQEQATRTKKDDAKLTKLQVALAEKAGLLEAAEKKVRLEEEKRIMEEEKAKQKEEEAKRTGVMSEDGVMKIVVLRLRLNYRFGDSVNTSSSVWDVITEEMHMAVDSGELQERDRRPTAHYQAKWALVVGQYKKHWAQCWRAMHQSGVSVDELEVRVVEHRSAGPHSHLALAFRISTCPHDMMMCMRMRMCTCTCACAHAD